MTEYDALGNQVASVDALGRKTEYQYDERGQLTGIAFPDGTSTAIGYDELGRRIRSTDRAGHTTRFTYDALGRLIETIFPDNTPDDDSDNPRSRTEYDAAGRVTAQIDGRGNRTEFEYDEAGRQILVRDALGNETVTEYDAAGRVTAVSDALGRTTQFVYDSLGRQTHTIFVDGTSTLTEYDSLGRVVGQTDQAGNVTRFEYDPLGRLAAVVDALEQRTEYTYDEAGNLTSQKDANGHVTTFEYDLLGRRVVMELPLGQRNSVAHNAVGNVVSTTDFNGDTIEFEYDLSNRLIEKRFPDGTSTTFAYTPQGQRSTIVDARGVTSYEYDERNRLIARTDPDGTTIEYTYDAAGNRLSVSIPSGTTHYTFDALNRLSTVIDPEGDTTTYSYDAVGMLVQTEFPNGTVEEREYDELNRLLFLENSGPAGVISSYQYTLDEVGHRLAVEEHSGRRLEYGYDALYRLLGEAIFDSELGDRTISYIYDPVGNRLTRDDSSEGVTSYLYDANDRLLEETIDGLAMTYSYDDNGNTLSRQSATDSVFYEWDYENRLVAVDTDGDGVADIQYEYDADGIRVASTVGGEETRFLVDSNRPYAQVLEEYTPGGVIKVSFVHGLDLISQNRPATTDKSFYHVDGLGSTRALTNSSGLVTDTYIYDAFGQTIGQVGSTGNVYLFAGEQRDLATGLDYLRARWMSPNAGRFYGMDPFEGTPLRPMTLHRFIYANGNPLAYTDPSGLISISEMSTAIAIQSMRFSLYIARAARFGGPIHTAILNAATFETALILSGAAAVLPLMLYTNAFAVNTQITFNSFFKGFFDTLVLGVDSKPSAVSPLPDKVVTVSIKGSQLPAGIHAEFNTTDIRRSTANIESGVESIPIGNAVRRGVLEFQVFGKAVMSAGVGGDSTFTFVFGIGLEASLLFPPRDVLSGSLDVSFPGGVSVGIEALGFAGVSLSR